MKLTPEAELTKYSKMLEYWKLNPIGHETTIKHLEIKINQIKADIKFYKRYIRPRIEDVKKDEKKKKRQEYYQSKKDAAK